MNSPDATKGFLPYRSWIPEMRTDMIDLAIELVDYGGEEPQRELITCVPEAGDVTAMGTYITLHHSDPLTLINDRTVLAVRSSNWSCSPIEWEFEIGKNS